ncbi:MAG: hypothetical protein ACI9XZ_003003 [Alphaproteobacteria bacterium]|jgi:hypothetical protein
MTPILGVSQGPLCATSQCAVRNLTRLESSGRLRLTHPHVKIVPELRWLCVGMDACVCGQMFAVHVIEKGIIY